METPEDKHWAHKALIDPLNEPEPFAEDGPGTSFRAASVNRHSASSTSAKLQKGNSFRKSSSSSKSTLVGAKELSRRDGSKAYPSPPPSASPRKHHFSHRQEAFGAYRETPPPPPPKDGVRTSTVPLRRGSSLKERYPSDKFHRPLDAIKQERKAADRAPHLRSHHQIRPDVVDRLDPTGRYHHEGPFDATYYARNTSYISSPLEALAGSNEEALKATPRDRILDSVYRHRPLDGVASYAPGQVDQNGQFYDYEPGDNMMIYGNPEGGAYKRWPGMQYHPDDIKGKGEPSYTIERSLKEHKSRRRAHSHSEGIELGPRPQYMRRTSEKPSRHVDFGEGAGQALTPHNSVRRSDTTGRQDMETKLTRGSTGGGSIRRRFGSIRRSLGGGGNRTED